MWVQRREAVLKRGNVVGNLTHVIRAIWSDLGRGRKEHQVLDVGCCALNPTRQHHLAIF